MQGLQSLYDFAHQSLRRSWGPQERTDPGGLPALFLDVVGDAVRVVVPGVDQARLENLLSLGEALLDSTADDGLPEVRVGLHRVRAHMGLGLPGTSRALVGPDLAITAQVAEAAQARQALVTPDVASMLQAGGHHVVPEGEGWALNLKLARSQCLYSWERAGREPHLPRKVALQQGVAQRIFAALHDLLSDLDAIFREETEQYEATHAHLRASIWVRSDDGAFAVPTPFRLDALGHPVDVSQVRYSVGDAGQGPVGRAMGGSQVKHLTAVAPARDRAAYLGSWASQNVTPSQVDSFSRPSRQVIAIPFAFDPLRQETHGVLCIDALEPLPLSDDALDDVLTYLQALHIPLIEALLQLRQL